MQKFKQLQNRIWEILENTKDDDQNGRIDDYFLLILIILNVIAMIIGSVNSIQEKYSLEFYYFELISIIIFTIEYILRLWVCICDKKYQKGLSGRVRYALTPMALIDLLAILPFYLPFTGLDLRAIRIFRLLQFFRIAKSARYVTSLRLFARVIKSRKSELAITSIVMFMLIIFASTLMYHFEGDVQPDKFPDIPTSMWWAVSTMTTVGYGDVIPITGIGKFIASIVAILGIGLFALPTGILGAGFIEELQKKKKNESIYQCPNCGHEIKSN